LPRWVGYAWAFPRPDHISFGIATTQDAFEHQPLDELLWQFMIAYYQHRDSAKVNFWTAETDRETAKIRQYLDATAERYAARIPGLAAQTWDDRKTCGEDWALLGDAAGFADPVTGEGIYYALRSAELFAASYLRRDLPSYETVWRQDFGAELRRAAQMRRRFYGNFWGAPFTDRMIEFAKGHRGVKRVLGNLVAGEQGYVNLKKKLLKSALMPLIAVALFAALATQASAQKVRQPRDVIAAYEVCNKFQQLLAQDLDFSRAFEATFTTDPARRRRIAISEGEFGNVDLTKVDDATVVGAFKSRMQIVYLMLPLASPDSNEQEQEFFPPPIKAIFERKTPEAPEEFASFAAQLKRDASDLRAHLNQLADRDREVAERLRKFKSDLAKTSPPPKQTVKPLTAYSRGNVLPLNQEYYQIGAYAVIRERDQMKIIGIRFFSSLF